MLSKAKIKFIKSLQIKKYRKEAGCFVVEGAKSVRELLASDFEVQTLIGTTEFLSTATVRTGIEIVEAAARELEGLGEFQTNESALAVVKLKPNEPFEIQPDEYALVLDDIRDPGNLGTIIRTADWFGIKKIVASTETADFYNQKVISATMGSFTRTNLFYTELPSYLSTVSVPVFGTYLNGRNLDKLRFPGHGLIIIGNESRGISSELDKFVTQRVTIPRLGGAESLNAAIAAGILCYAATRA
jgi:TrmH family RNA methyltransferase